MLALLNLSHELAHFGLQGVLGLGVLSDLLVTHLEQHLQLLAFLHLLLSLLLNLHLQLLVVVFHFVILNSDLAQFREDLLTFGSHLLELALRLLVLALELRFVSV